MSLLLLFFAQEIDKSSYECWNSASLFGALVKARGRTLDLRLDIPDLPNDASGIALELKIPKLTEVSVFIVGSESEI